MASLSDIHRTPAHIPLAYFITIRAYGTWLHGDSRGSIDRNHNTPHTPYAPPNPALEQSARDRLTHDPITFQSQAIDLILRTVTELCAHRQWHLFAANMRSNHLHVVVESQLSPERVMSDIKSRTTRLLREQGFIHRTHHPWSHHGSTPYLWTPDELLNTINYVLNRQGPPLSK